MSLLPNPRNYPPFPDGEADIPRAFEILKSAVSVDVQSVADDEGSNDDLLQTANTWIQEQSFADYLTGTAPVPTPGGNAPLLRLRSGTGHPAGPNARAGLDVGIASFVGARFWSLFGPWVDFAFRVSTGVERLIRFENRDGIRKAGQGSFHIAGEGPDDPTLAVGDELITIRPGVKVGIGTRTPTSTLTIAAAPGQTTPILEVVNSVGTPLFKILSTGDVQFENAGAGPIIREEGSGTFYRLKIVNGNVTAQVVA